MAINIKKTALKTLGKLARRQGEWQKKKVEGVMIRVIGKPAWASFLECHDLNTEAMLQGRIMTPEEVLEFMEISHYGKIEVLKHWRAGLDRAICSMEEAEWDFARRKEEEVDLHLSTGVKPVEGKEVGDLLYAIGGRVPPMRGVHKYWSRHSRLLPDRLTPDQLAGLRELGVAEIEKVAGQVGVSAGQLWLFLYDHWGLTPWSEGLTPCMNCGREATSCCCESGPAAP